MTTDKVRGVKNPAGKRLNEALEFVRDRLDQLESLPHTDPYSDAYVQWFNVTDSGLVQYFGRDSEEYRWVFPKITLVQDSVIIGRSQAEIDRKTRERYEQDVRNKRTGLQSILEKYRSTPAASHLAFWHPILTTSRSVLKRLLSSLAALPRLVRWLVGLVVTAAVSAAVAIAVQWALS